MGSPLLFSKDGDVMRLADTVMRILLSQGFEVYKVGGYVRDYLLGHNPTDVDLATNATPDQVQALFSRQGFSVDLVGKNFGVVIVNGIEVASYRTETYNVRGKPDVRIVRNFYEDSSRRDFTINAMGLTQDNRLIDWHGGKQDLNRKLIRAVGNPKERFDEDPSRILRGIELASRLGFKIESKTKAEMRNSAYLLQHIPYALVGKIVKKAIYNKRLGSFLKLLEQAGALPYVFPELVHTVGLPQNPRYHKYPVFDHIVAVIRAAERRKNPVLALAGLFHDVAKGLDGARGVNAQGQPSDIGHEEAGVPIARTVLQRLEFDKHVVHDVLFLVNFHGIRLEANPKRSTCLRVLRRLSLWYKTKKDLSRAVQLLFTFMQCDAEGFSESFKAEMKADLAQVKPRVMDVLRDSVFYPSDLPISGNDLVLRGYKGKEIGEILQRLIELNKTSKDGVLAYLDRLELKRFEANS